MMRVLLLHGWGGSDFPHWQSWLARELAKNYGNVHFLRLPDFDTPDLESWIEATQKALDERFPDVVVCHSLGNTLWFHLCNEGMIQKEVKNLFLVAPPSLKCEIKELESFFPVRAPQKLFAKSVKLIVSDNDPYMTQKEAASLQKTLGVEMEVLPNAGHINAESGFGEWHYIYEEIEKCKL